MSSGRGIRAQPARLYSAGGLGSSARKTMGLTSPGQKLADLPPQVLGAALGAFHGGLTEAAIVRCRLPAVVADFSSAYPTLARLLGVWKVLRAERVDVDDVTGELADWLSELAAMPWPDLLATLTDPATWGRWGATVALVRPAGEWLVHRRRKANGEYTSCMGPLFFDGLLPYSWCDLAAAIVTSNNRPHTPKAWRAMPHGIEQGLHAVMFPGGMVFDPNDQDVDFFAFLLRFRRASRDDATMPPYAQLRRERTAKTMGSSISYGNLARYDRPLVEAKTDTVAVLDPWGEIFESPTPQPEQAGPDTCPILASNVTAGCRLVMAMLRRSAAEDGVDVAAVLTDAAIIPASTGGGVVACPGGDHVTAEGSAGVRLLDRATLSRLLRPFDRLALDGASAFKLIHGTDGRDLDVTVYGRNRYLVIDPATNEVVHDSEFALGGVFADPAYGEEQLIDGRRRWVAEAVTVAAMSDTGSGPLPLIRIAPFGQAMAVSPFTITSPEHAKWFDLDIRPFTQALAAHVDRFATAEMLDADGEPEGAPVALYDPDPEAWPFLDWRRRDGSRTRPVLHAGAVSTSQDTFVPKRIDDVLGDWCQGREPGTRPAGYQLSRTARGLLTRVPARGLPGVDLLGREGAQLVERQTGIVRPDEVQTVYRSTSATAIAGVDGALVRQMVVALGQAKVAVLAGITRRRLGRLLTSQPTNLRTGPAVINALRTGALLYLAESGADATLVEAPAEAIFTEYLKQGWRADSERTCAAPGCEAAARPRGEYCSTPHRRAASQRRYRARQRSLRLLTPGGKAP
jgi:hypothetical protein